MQGTIPAHSDLVGLRGRVEILVFQGDRLIDQQELRNIILTQGHREVLKSITSALPLSPRIINRMSVGDQGTIPADSTVAKVPTKDMTGLYHEVFRKDCENRVVVMDSTKNECMFIATFAASEIPLTAYSNPSQPRVNEVGLVLIDPSSTSGLDRDSVASPDLPEEDEVLFSIRCFKSIPFEAENDVSITIRYTIYME